MYQNVVNIFPMYWSENIAQLRKSLGESQEEFAARFGIKRSLVGKWERGETEPQLAALLELEKLAGVPLSQFCTQRLTREVLGSSYQLVAEPGRPTYHAGLGQAAVLAALEEMRLAMEAERETAAAERAENARFRKEITLLKKRMELLDAEVLRIGAKGKK